MEPWRGTGVVGFLGILVSAGAGGRGYNPHPRVKLTETRL